jgi:hypothetical protein
MTQEERNIIRDQIGREISILEKSINTLSELIRGEVQSDANDWFTSRESNPSKEINELAMEKEIPACAAAAADRPQGGLFD